MTPRVALNLVIQPTLDWLGAPYNKPEAALVLVAIGLVESNFATRLQAPVAHAKGFWQFERNGGCAEFEQSPKLGYLRTRAAELGFPVARAATWDLLGRGADNLACLLARSILWLDPAPLPTWGDEREAYRQYLARWRPGKPSWSRFQASYATALKVF